MLQGIRFAASAALVIVAATTANAGLNEDIGYASLADRLGPATPDAAGLVIAQVEASETQIGQPVAFVPDPVVFPGITFTYHPDLADPANHISTHATNVAGYLYGSSSIASGAGSVQVHQTNTYLTSMLRPFAGGDPQAPVVHAADVYNHSYDDQTNIAATDYTLRLNHVIDRDRLTVVVTTDNDVVVTTDNDNDADSGLSDLFAQTHNAIVVGRSDGEHAYGPTSIAGAGRVKPDIVAPLPGTSYAAPVVAASAALLIDQARSTPALVDADRPEVVKAALMAGAVKEPFGADWDRTASRPLDEVYGAGQVNIDRSHRIITAGPQDSAAAVANTGWDFASTDAAPTRYHFNVAPGQSITELSAVLTWHQTVHDAAANEPDRFAPTADPLANLDLKLFLLPTAGPEVLLDASISSVDNVEHIHYAAGLAPGEYALQVKSDLAEIDYGLAWHSTAIPEPAAAALLTALAAAHLFIRRRRTAGAIRRAT